MNTLILRLFCLSLLLNCLFVHAQTVNTVEYFWDNDPGYGNGTIVSASTGENNLQVNYDEVNYGVHTLWIRIQDSCGNWSTTIGKPIFIKKDAASTITRMEYFWDNDPGYGKAKSISPNQMGNNEYAISTTDVSDGAHLFCMRAKDDQEQWSMVITKPIYAYTVNGNITDMEYFIDNDPGEGNGIKVALTENVPCDANFYVKTDNLSIGSYQLNVRIKDCYGKWGLLSSEPFEITEVDGVEKIEFSMPINITVSKGTCVLQSDNLIMTDYKVRIISLDGRTLSSTIWNSYSNICEINIGVINQPIIVIVENDNHRLVKRVMAK